MAEKKSADFEKSLGRLEELVGEMEGGELSLETKIKEALQSGTFCITAENFSLPLFRVMHIPVIGGYIKITHHDCILMEFELRF